MPMALTRPIEITASNKDFRFGYDAVGPSVFAIPEGLYGSVLTLITEIEAAIAVTYANIDVYLTSDFKIAFDYTGASTITLDWLDNDLGPLLGFYREGIEAAPMVAGYTPQHCWLPTYETSDPEAWKYTPVFSGAVSVSGLLSGISLASGRYNRTATWPVEYDYNSKISRAVTSTSWAATTYYPQQERCFEQFIDDVKTAEPTASTAEGINMKGFYIIHDRSVYTGTSPTVAIPSSMGSGGVDTEFSSSPDRYVYCSILPNALPSMPLSADGQQLFHDCSIPLHTATAPTWNQP